MIDGSGTEQSFYLQYIILINNYYIMDEMFVCL